MTRYVPRMLCGRFRSSALFAAGLRYFASSSLLCPSGVRTIAMSQWTPSSSLHWSATGPCTSALPSSSIPSATH